MRDEHIKGWLDAAPLDSLGGQELAALRAHAAGCEECRRALEAAQAAGLLLKLRAAETFEPSPFFQTRVLAAMRERRVAEEGWTLARLWRSAGLLVSSMAVTVAALAVLTFTAPQQQAAPQELASGGGAYSAEALLFDEAGAGDEQMSYGQVMTTLYESEEETER